MKTLPIGTAIIWNLRTVENESNFINMGAQRINEWEGGEVNLKQNN